jgi:uroporphyrinogen decarboxylase
MTGRSRFLSACARKEVDRPPIWIMRQAGRYLPEYRQLKKRYSFHDLVKTPELAVEVTLQPIRRYGFDAAITFSDILVIPEALGQPYRFAEAGGIEMEFVLRDRETLSTLKPGGIEGRLDYVPRAQEQLRRDLGNEHALLGFCGSPWTLAAYMVSGRGLKEAGKLADMAGENPDFFQDLMELLVESTAIYLNMQIQAGVDAVQIFDSASPSCPVDRYREWSLDWIQAVIERLPERVPVILYARETAARLSGLAAIPATVLSVDEEADLPAISKDLPDQCLQGNFHPDLMKAEPDEVEAQVKKQLAAMSGRPGWIVNLGHGIRPEARLESVEALVETVKKWQDG